MSSYAFVRLIPAAGTAAVLFAGAAFAGPELIDFPQGYQDDWVHYGTVNRDDRKQVVKLYANDVALRSAKDGVPLDDGAVVVMDVYKAKLDDAEEPVTGPDGYFETGEFAFIAVMEKGEGWGEEYPEEIRNDGWEYAGFDPQTHERIERDYTGCFECHKPQADAAYMFTFDALEAEAGG